MIAWNEHGAPFAEGPCVRCKTRKPGGTPFLCLPCLIFICRDYTRSKFKDYPTAEDQVTASAKNFQNRVQKYSRDAYCRIEQGELPKTPDGF